MLASAPKTVFVLRVGHLYFEEPSVGSCPSTIRFFLTKEAADLYKTEVEPFPESAIQVHEVAFDEFYNETAFWGEVMETYLVLAGPNAQGKIADLETVFDPRATIH